MTEKLSFREDTSITSGDSSHSLQDTPSTPGENSSQDSHDTYPHLHLRYDPDRYDPDRDDPSQYDESPPMYLSIRHDYRRSFPIIPPHCRYYAETELERDARIGNSSYICVNTVFVRRQDSIVRELPILYDPRDFTYDGQPTCRYFIFHPCHCSFTGYPPFPISREILSDSFPSNPLSPQDTSHQHLSSGPLRDGADGDAFLCSDTISPPLKFKSTC
jgi:hypothetical protein